ncbi:unnamed protein product [Parnassius apollo]|uniref:(apollo) hypothetical protein n=1 Tax=Parnassius apollo TaxID=110799 RepID=A0A8S3XA92_PARAO|nr:unnamed protein product [Parnassius apollo]
MYATPKNGLRKCSNVDEARLRIFTQTYTNKIEPTDEFKQKLMNFDACILPPCKRELQQQLLRAAYIRHMWKNYFSPVPNESLNVEEFGWKLENNSYSFRWFEGDDILPNVQEIIEAPKESVANDEEVISMYPNFDDEEDDKSNNDDDSDCQSDIGYTTEEESVHSRDDDDDNNNDNVDNDDEAVDDNDN